MQHIFNHLRKIRTTKYPILRALRLVEAISRDLSQQLLKVSINIFCICLLYDILYLIFYIYQVLGTRRLMHIPFDEFERVMTQCFKVFSCWDDEYDKLQGLLRYVIYIL